MNDIYFYERQKELEKAIKENDVEKIQRFAEEDEKLLFNTYWYN